MRYRPRCRRSGNTDSSVTSRSNRARSCSTEGDCTAGEREPGFADGSGTACSPHPASPLDNARRRTLPRHKLPQRLPADPIRMNIGQEYHDRKDRLVRRASSTRCCRPLRRLKHDRPQGRMDRRSAARHRQQRQCKRFAGFPRPRSPLHAPCEAAAASSGMNAREIGNSLRYIRQRTAATASRSPGFGGAANPKSTRARRRRANEWKSLCCSA